ncbi:Mitochondrial carrier protein LEU5 [Penicillium atrosanguineum]|uniref:Mitochondrial carrier protein LEU5 n=1 Tax=Penicillium atrosanguineum TaxID=1132637 RepID=UPI0023A385BA|nr:Mitochondrial carrier protein LEU5 [Penicillium atrosanguineum]KAJ5141856.1 hypothetical protein N7526_002851 [Penicillium atrosanguineum]KAJ5298452.1 Mitochondrial carrier protein LEU5 [Penicillium atrosanguineum]
MTSDTPASSLLTRDLAEINKLVTEQDDNSFYHHPLWSERWSHPEFIGHYSNNWLKAPWIKQTKRRTTRFLYPSVDSKFPWGYIIYRTVYTAESDELWPIAMDKLAKVINYSIDSDFLAEIQYKEPEDPEPDADAERLVKETHKDVIFSDKQFWDGASTEQVRQHFSEYLRASKGRGTGRFEGCLLIDERSLKSIVASPDPQPWVKGRRTKKPSQPWGFIGMIDGRYPENRYEPRYTGYMRVEIFSLWNLYTALTFRYMQELCPSVPDGLIPVYDSGTGKAQDEEGNVFPTAADRTTRIF